MQFLETRSEVKFKVTVTQLWYATLRLPKMYPHTKFGIPTSKNLGDMHRIRSGMDGRTDGRTDRRTDGQCNYYMPPKVPLEHKNSKKSHVQYRIFKLLFFAFSPGVLSFRLVFFVVFSLFRLFFISLDVFSLFRLFRLLLFRLFVEP